MKEVKNQGRNQMESILRNYTAMKKELQVLEFELGRISPSLRSEDIVDRMFAHSAHEKVAGSQISDKTADIVIEHIDGQRNSVYHALSALVYNNRVELQRVEHYMSLLPKDEADVIRLSYFDLLSWDEIAQMSACSLSTLQRRRKKGVDKLVYYYSILSDMTHDSLDLRTRLRFISYIHEERFASCLHRIKKRTLGIEASLFIISGCNELWAAGIETFFDFEGGKTISYADKKLSFSDDDIKMLRLAYHLAGGIQRNNLVSDLWHHCASLKYVNLELAIEAVKLALLPDDQKLT